MYFEIEKQAIDAINKALDQYDVEVDRNFRLDFPPNPKLGDLASTIAFALTKKLKTSPPEVAKDLVEKIEVPEIFSKVQNFGPYVNFFIDYNKFSKLLLEKVDDNYGQLPACDEKIVLEHTSANPNGPLHIGHIRNSIFGDSLARLLKLAGRDVTTQYYVNDMGRQIAIIVCGITELGLKIEDYEGEKVDHKVGKLYFDANKAVEESKGKPNYTALLCAAAGIHDQAGDYEKAEQMYKESSEIQPNQFEANYGMGSMMNNRASEKNETINKMIAAGDYSDEATALMDKLTEERNEYLRKAIPYLNSAINFIDALDENAKAQHRPNLYSCLKALNACYVTLEMYNESKAIQQRIATIEAGQ